MKCGASYLIFHMHFFKSLSKAPKYDVNQPKSSQPLEVALYVIFWCVMSHQDPVPQAFSLSWYQWTCATGLLLYRWFASFAKQHNFMNLSFTRHVTSILQNILLQNRIYISSNTCVTHGLYTLTRFSFSLTFVLDDFFLFRSLHEIRLPYQSVSLRVLLTNPPYLTSLSKQSALFWEPHINTCRATGLVFTGCQC